MSLLNLDQCRGRYNREVNACLVLVGRQNTVLRHSSSKQSLLKTRQQVGCMGGLCWPWRLVGG